MICGGREVGMRGRIGTNYGPVGGGRKHRVMDLCGWPGLIKGKKMAAAPGLVSEKR